jgi:hypothetical protein
MPGTLQELRKGNKMGNVVNIYEESLQVWGINAQMHKFSEELFELGVAIHHWYEDKIYPIALAEEIADVEIVCAQLRSIIGTEMVDERKIFKLKRLRKRVENAKKASSH